MSIVHLPGPTLLFSVHDDAIVSFLLLLPLPSPVP